MSGNTWEKYTFLWGKDVNAAGQKATFIWGISASVIEELKKKAGGSRGGLRRQFDLWNAWDHLTDKNKKKIITVLIYLETGEVKSTTKEIDEYEVTVDKIEYMIEQYDLWKANQKRLSGINVDIDEPKMTTGEKKIKVEVE